MTEHRRKLIEVALPLEAINAASRADKNRKTGTIRNLHKWFAPMPGPAWRALLLASLIDDPGDPDARRQLMSDLVQMLPANGSLPLVDAEKLSTRLIRQSGIDPAEVLIFDPFVGGGSTLVEAQRLGLSTIGSDLNPVPALISRFLTCLLPAIDVTRPQLGDGSQIMIDDPSAAFVADAQVLANEIRDRVFAKIGHFYPTVDGRTVIAWLWAHSIPCRNPACAVVVPLHGSNVLLKRKGAQAWLANQVLGDRVVFRVVEKSSLASLPTKTAGQRASFRCPKCDTVVDDRYIKAHVSALAIQPMALVTAKGSDRNYFGSADGEDSFCANLGVPAVDSLPLPDSGLGLRIQAYGFKNYNDLFTNRQQHALLAFSTVVSEICEELPRRISSKKYADALSAFLGLCVGKLAHIASKQATWRIDSRNGSSKAEAAFGQSVLPMVWDFAETNPFGGSVGDWSQVVETALRAVSFVPRSGATGRVELADARGSVSGVDSNKRVLIATDPPYFDAIGYADLSDFFYLWHRLALRSIFPDLYETAAVPRSAELVSDPGRHQGSAEAATKFFIDGFSQTFDALIDRADVEFPMLVVYAHQQKDRSYGEYGSTGWEAMLQAAINAGLRITASWPVHCTSETRRRGQGSNALASYIVLACRRRADSAGVTSRRGFITELRADLPRALRELQQGSVAPVDMAQAAIGPGMAVFTGYSRVVEVDGSDMSVRTALALINQVLDETLSEQEGDFDSDTRFCVKWFSQFAWDEADSGTADVLARATNTSIEGLQRGGVFRAVAGKARLLGPDDLSDSWDPLTDVRTSVWEASLRLAKAVSERGSVEAAELMVAAGQRVDLEVVKELAYLLYNISERKGWTSAALLFNGLGTSWIDLDAAARASAKKPKLVAGMLKFDEDEA